jgi:ABC-2 type transport system ATP-binding protein
MILKVEAISKSFGAKKILNNISFDVNSGEIFSLIGPNGAGKTTTLRCLYGDLKSETGVIEIFGEEYKPSLKKKIAVMSEDRLTFKRFTGEDYLKIWSMLYPNFDNETFSDFSIHYNYDLKQKVDTFSMGMKTLFHIALTISTNADLLILDEPTQNLDPVIRKEILEILKEYVENKEKSIIISSHEIYELEEITNSFAIIKEGRILYTDNLDNAKEKHRIINKGEVIPQGEVISTINENVLVKTEEDVGDYANFRDISLAYLKEKKSFKPFSKSKK